MWSLGKILNTPEVPRVYIGSFWNQPLVHTTNQLLFEIEEQDLFRDLQSLPRNAALRKLNDFIKRARLAKRFTTNSRNFDAKINSKNNQGLDTGIYIHTV